MGFLVEGVCMLIDWLGILNFSYSVLFIKFHREFGSKL